MRNTMELAITRYTEDSNHSTEDCTCYVLPSFRAGKRHLRNKDEVELLLHEFGCVSVESLDFPIRVRNFQANKVFLKWTDLLIDPKFVFDKEEGVWVLQDDCGISFDEHTSLESE